MKTKELKKQIDNSKMVEEVFGIALREKLYNLMDGFLVETDPPRTIDQLNRDRHLFVKNMLEIFAERDEAHKKELEETKRSIKKGFHFYCENCGCIVYKPKAHYDRHKTHFCSKTCYADYKKTRTTKPKCSWLDCDSISISHNIHLCNKHYCAERSERQKKQILKQKYLSKE